MKKIILKNNKIYIKEKDNVQLKEWDPFRSKIAAGIKKGINLSHFLRPEHKVLYLGAAEGYTISFISEIAKEVVGIDISPYSMQKLLLLANTKKNITPVLADCNQPESYKEKLKEKFDWVIQDISQKNQIEILLKNIKLFLKDKGGIILSLKLSAISQKDHKKLIEKQLDLLSKEIKIIERKRLEPFEKKHVLVVGFKK